MKLIGLKSVSFLSKLEFPKLSMKIMIVISAENCVRLIGLCQNVADAK